LAGLAVVAHHAVAELAGDVQVAVRPEGQHEGMTEPAAVRRHEEVEELSRGAVVTKDTVEVHAADVEVAVRSGDQTGGVLELAAAGGHENIQELPGRFVEAKDPVAVRTDQQVGASVRDA